MSDKRTWQCFVCGIMHQTYEEFKSHIIKEHDEGREYVKCPLGRCQAPVRDLRAHFRHKHPHDKYPHGCQYRPAIMYDVRNPSRKKKIVSFKNGDIVSLKNNGQTRHYRSGFELEVYMCLEKMNEVVRYDVEPFAVEYYHKGRRKNYYPDLKVNFADGRTEIWEVKPANQRILDINTAKWEACRHYCMLRGWSFEVKDEQKIKDLKRETK